MSAVTSATKRLRGLLVASLAVVVAASCAALVSPSDAKAATGLGCTFTASAPWVASNGRIYTRFTLRCSYSRTLLVRGRLTKHRQLLTDVTAGSYDSWVSVDAGVNYTWYLSNNRVTCPGSGEYFGKLTIQASTYSTIYESRSWNSPITHC